MKQEKNNIILFLLCFFFGFMGTHRFYVEKSSTGVLYLLTFGLLLIGTFIDLITIITGNFKDKEGNKISW